MKDAAEEFEQLDSDMNAEAGQKGEDWSDADANRYGGDLDKLQTKIEKLAKQKAKVKAALLNYRMS
jgi:chaperonin cofactor prefoldin